MAENDGNGKITKVARWQADDGTIVTTQSGATAYEESLITREKEERIWLDGQKKMINRSITFIDENSSYAMISGRFSEKGGLYQAFATMFTETPELTQKIITTIDSPEFAK